MGDAGRGMVPVGASLLNMASENTIMIVAGEASADAHAAALISELRKLRPGLEVYGLGGQALKAEGAELFLDFSRVGVVGLTEILPELKRFYQAYRALVKSIPERQPRGVILLDLPDFNLYLAKRIKKLRPETKIIYYISPQVWGWRPGRVKKIAKRADAMLVLFPFEKEIYQRAGMDVEFVGHPLGERVKTSAAREQLREELGVAGSRPVIALLPGSRKAEIEICLPIIAKFVLKLSGKRPETRFLLARAPTVDANMVRGLLGEAETMVTVMGERTWDVLGASDLAVVASGTATLETAILGVPMVVIGAVSRISYHIIKPLTLVDLYSLPNVISGREVVPELIQYDLTPQSLLEKVENMLDHPEVTEKMKAELSAVRKALGPKGASRRAALAVHGRLWGDFPASPPISSGERSGE